MYIYAPSRGLELMPATRGFLRSASSPTSVGLGQPRARMIAAPPELAILRTTLLSRLTASDLYWIDVPLRGGLTIKVCSPVRVRVTAQDLQPVAKYLDGPAPDGPFYLYPPVNANETSRLALQWNAFPLTRAVFDQAFNVSVYVPRVPWPPQNEARRMYDFVGYSQKLHLQMDYPLHHGVRLVAGAHKLWVLSARGPTVNHGFHAPIKECAKAIKTCVPGPLLDKRFAAIQDLGTRHDASHWDYSQLLQFMTDLRDPSGRTGDLGRAASPAAGGTLTECSDGRACRGPGAWPRLVRRAATSAGGLRFNSVLPSADASHRRKRALNSTADFAVSRHPLARALRYPRA